MRILNFQVPDRVVEYFVAIIAMPIAILIRFMLVPMIGEHGYQYVTVYPAILIVAIVAGRNLAIASTIFGSILGYYFFTEIHAIHSFLSVLILIATSVLAGHLTQRLKNALAKSKDDAATLGELTARYHGLFESIDEGFCILEIIFDQNQKAVDYRFLEINPSFQKQTGIVNGQGRTIREIAPENEEFWFETYGQIALTGKAKRFQAYAGQLHRWFDVYAFRFGKPEERQVAIIFNNITEYKQAEDTLRESEEKFRLLAENANAIIGIVQGEKFIYVNPYLEKISGYSSEELLEIDLRKMLHIDYQELVLDRARRRQAGEPVISHYEFIMITKSGEQKWMDFSPVLISYRGKPAIIGISLDITEQKKYQSQLEQARTQLTDKVKELETIIGVVSHDLRAPLLNIRGFSYVLKNDYQNLKKMFSLLKIPPEMKPQVEQIMNQSAVEAFDLIELSTKSMDNLIESLVKIARAGLVVPSPERLNMNELIKEVVNNIRIKFKDSGATIDYGQLPECFADRTHVTQIFMNLLDNAVKYLDPARPGHICVEGTIEKDKVLYWVSDNGIGIEKEDEEKIFNMFYQIGEKKGFGEGIGLATVKRLVERNNGNIWVVCEKDQGCNFFVRLPLGK